MQQRAGISVGGLGATSCGSPPAALPYSFGSLHAQFKLALEPFLVDLHGTGLSNYFKPAIGMRSLDKQCWAKCAGGSFIQDPSRGAHPNGLAVDFHATGPMAPTVFKAANGRYSKWTTGLDQASHTQVFNGAALELWKAFGEVVARHPKLHWGGLWKKVYTDKGFSPSEVLLGFDPYHVQLKGFAKYVTGPRYKCVGAKAVPLNKAEEAAAAKKAAFSNPWFWAGALGAGGLLLWHVKKK